MNFLPKPGRGRCVPATSKLTFADDRRLNFASARVYSETGDRIFSSKLCVIGHRRTGDTRIFYSRARARKFTTCHIARTLFQSLEFRLIRRENYRTPGFSRRTFRVRVEGSQFRSRCVVAFRVREGHEKINKKDINLKKYKRGGQIATVFGRRVSSVADDRTLPD